jgi:hypothetical protein
MISTIEEFRVLSALLKSFLDGSWEQLDFFPDPPSLDGVFRRVVQTFEDQRGGQFILEISEEGRDEFVRAAKDLDAEIIFIHATKPSLIELEEKDEIISADSLAPPPGCMYCGATGFIYMSCSCGELVWCQDCMHGSDFWFHADHECSPECCASGHTLALGDGHTRTEPWIRIQEIDWCNFLVWVEEPVQIPEDVF